MEIPFISGSYNLETREAAVQRTINMEPMPQEPGNERTAWVFKDVPGLVLVQDFAGGGGSETVLFLFHMTNSASAEGILEFLGDDTAVDQTGATWNFDVPEDILLKSSDPSPKFGALSLGAFSSLTVERDIPQATAPDDYSTASAAALQIDMWVYRADSSGGVEIQVGVESYPLNTTFSVRTDTDGLITFGYESPDEESYATAADFSVATDEWTLLRLLCVGNETRLYVNGEADQLVVTTVTGTPIADAGPINIMRLVFTGSGTYMDDARAVLHATTPSTANFTPPVAPWPNP